MKHMAANAGGRKEAPKRYQLPFAHKNLMKTKQYAQFARVFFLFSFEVFSFSGNIVSFYLKSMANAIY